MSWETPQKGEIFDNRGNLLRVGDLVRHQADENSLGTLTSLALDFETIGEGHAEVLWLHEPVVHMTLMMGDYFMPVFAARSSRKDGNYIKCNAGCLIKMLP